MKRCYLKKSNLSVSKIRFNKMSTDKHLIELHDQTNVEETEQLLSLDDKPIVVEVDGRERIEKWLLRRCDCRRYCCHDYNDRYRRPNCTPAILIVVLFSLMGLAFLPMGIWAVNSNNHYIRTNFTVAYYIAEKQFCEPSMLSDDDSSGRSLPWSISIYGKYQDYYHDENGTARPKQYVWTGDWIIVCGYYEDQGLTKARQKYPINMTIPAWIWDDGTGYLTFRNPHKELQFLYVSISFIIAAALGWILHSISVLCFGFKGIDDRMDDQTTLRILDPYRDGSIK